METHFFWHVKARVTVYGAAYEECSLPACHNVWLLLRNDVSEEPITPIIWEKRIGGLGTSVLTGATWRHIPEDSIPQVLLLFLTNSK
jgi:hypothetical protein